MTLQPVLTFPINTHSVPMSYGIQYSRYSAHCSIWSSLYSWKDEIKVVLLCYQAKISPCLLFLRKTITECLEKNT